MSRLIVLIAILSGTALAVPPINPSTIAGEWDWTCTECWNSLLKLTPEKAGYHIRLSIAIDSSDTTAKKVLYSFFKDDTIPWCSGTSNVTYPFLPTWGYIVLAEFTTPLMGTGKVLLCEGMSAGCQIGSIDQNLSFAEKAIDARRWDFVSKSTEIRSRPLLLPNTPSISISQQGQRLILSLPPGWIGKSTININTLSGKCIFNSKVASGTAIPKPSPGFYLAKISNGSRVVLNPFVVH